jgi:hypothetical protein
MLWGFRIGVWVGHYGSALELDVFSRNRGDAFARNDDTGEVHGVGSGYGDDLFRELMAGVAKGLGGFGEGELFAGEAGDEAAATDLAAGFEAAKDVEKLAPLGSVGLAGEEIAEEDAVAGEEHASEGLDGLIGAAGFGDGRGAWV